MTDQPQPQLTFPSGTLTFLFTDIEGSTARWEHYREAMTAALARHDVCLRGAIEPRGGTVFKLIGDAFHVAFASPVDALWAAVDAQRALAAEDWSACGEGFPDLRVRMALHIGPATIDARGDYRTPLLNRVARIEAAGHGGQVLLSSDVAAAIGAALPSSIRLRDLGEHRLKDLRHAEHIFQAVAEGMPDITKMLRSVGELGARDRIIVRDAAGDGEDTLAGRATVVDRSVAETFAELSAVLRGDKRTVVLTADEVRAAAQHRPADLREYRLTRIAAWSQPRYRLDGRFVELTLLVDQGEESAAGRWAAKEERYADPRAILKAVPDPAIVILGPPGSGKSTLLRRLELDLAIDALRGEGDGPGAPLTFFIQLNQYSPPGPGDRLPAPGEWLAERWSSRFPDLTALDDLLTEGRLILLLDALNEMPSASDREMLHRVGLWKGWLQRLAADRPGNRVIFSCRSLDYSQPLSTPALRVPQVQIEPLNDAQVRDFLGLYSPSRWREIWTTLEGSPQLEALRAPFFLTLLVDQVEATGELAADRAGLFTGFVRQALTREVERDNPLFALPALLDHRDVRRIAQRRWRDAYELPERGALVPKLAALAYGMQESEADGESSQVRLDYDTALELLDHPEGEAIVKAGLSIAVLDEDLAADELLFRHQLLQEYFAARVLAGAPRPGLVAAPWRAADMPRKLGEILASLPPAETLPALPTTGWEETTVLAAAMAADADGYVRGLMASNLALAGRSAAQPMLRGRLSVALLEELRWALVTRSRDQEADLRARMAAGLALGPLGDPRFERRVGPMGAYLVPPMAAIPGGVYPIGEDAPILNPQTKELVYIHRPRHLVELAPFALGCFAVTNAEFACFVAGGGYEDEQWWSTTDARSWRRGEGTAEGSKRSARLGVKYVRENPSLLESWHDSGQIDDDTHERWRRRLAMSPAELEAHLAELYPGGRLTEPRYWRDPRYNNPAQPVVGVSWFEARAFCRWLSAQTGVAVSLPTEAEREAAARGRTGRPFAYGDEWDALGGNTSATHVKQPSPVGVFVAGDTPEGLSDLAGNTGDWTSSLYGRLEDDDDRPEFAYPYDPQDGRENASAGVDVLRVVRGGRWDSSDGDARAAFRDVEVPGNRYVLFGLRIRAAAPIA